VLDFISEDDDVKFEWSFRNLPFWCVFSDTLKDHQDILLSVIILTTTRFMIGSYTLLLDQNKIRVENNMKKPSLCSKCSLCP